MVDARQRHHSLTTPSLVYKALWFVSGRQSPPVALDSSIEVLKIVLRELIGLSIRMAFYLANSTLSTRALRNNGSI